MNDTQLIERSTILADFWENEAARQDEAVIEWFARWDIALPFALLIRDKMILDYAPEAMFYILNCWNDFIEEFGIDESEDVAQQILTKFGDGSDYISE